MVDQYVAGEVDPAEREWFEKHFLKSQARAKKVRFAQALQAAGKTAVVHYKAKWSYRHLAIAASVIVALAIGFVVWRTIVGQSDVDKGLVALQNAYRDERPIAGRITGFNYAPQSDQRGGSQRVDYLQLDYAARLLFPSVAKSSDARALHAAGQYYLTQKDFDKAIDQLKRAIELDPAGATIQIDLGTALLQKGLLLPPEGSERSIVFANSLEHFNKGLELNSNLLEGYFNRALLYQQMGLIKQAEVEWQEYLKRDPSSPWANEAKRNLELLKQRSADDSRTLDESFRAFPEARRAGNEEAAWQIFVRNYRSSGNLITNKLLNAVVSDSTANHTAATDINDPAYLGNLEVSRVGDRYTSQVTNDKGEMSFSEFYLPRDLVVDRGGVSMRNEARATPRFILV